MKVSDAEKKICPFIQLSYSKYVVAHGEPKNIQCITSSCIAWKMTKTHYETSDLTDEERRQIKPPDRYYNMPEEDYEGYCIRLGKGH